MTPDQTTQLLRRLCQHLGIAFSANRVFPNLADIATETSAFPKIDSSESVQGMKRSDSMGNTVPMETQLSAVGKELGLRFRPLEGTTVDLLNTVGNSGAAVIRGPELAGGEEGNPILILGTTGNRRFRVHIDGEDKTMSLNAVRKLAPKNGAGLINWLLVQPILAAEGASRFQYQTGTSANPMKPLKRLLAILRPEYRDIRTILIFSVVIGILSLTTPLAVEAVVNTIAFGRYIQPLVILSIIMMTFLAFRAALTVLNTIIAEIIQRKIFVRTVEDLAYRMTRVPLAKWKKYHGPELVNRFFDVFNVQKITTKLLVDSFSLILQTIIGLTVLAFYHPFLLGYDVALLVLMSVVLWLIGRGAVNTAKEESRLKYETAAWLQEIVRHPATYKFNGGLGFAINRADELAATYIGFRRDHFRILLRQISFLMVMQVVAATVLLALGGYLVIEGQLTLGQLVAAELIVTMILSSFAKIGKDLESFYDLMASVDKLGKLFDLEIEPIDRLELAARSGADRLSLVNFGLTSGGATNCNLTFEPAASYAVHGGGELRRTKLLEALIGQAMPNSGHVLLNDYRVDSISIESTEHHVNLIQDIELFEGTVDDNIRLGRKGIGSEQVNRIIALLGLQGTITSLPDGLNNSIAVSGYPLSQGQAIRLMLARGLIDQPGVLLIDGLLDRLSDDDTVEVLECLEPFKEATTIVISTGRETIARWAEFNLDVGAPNWELAKRGEKM